MGIWAASLVEDGVGVGPPFGGQGGLLAGEVLLEPFDHGAGGDLAAFDRILAGDHGVGVGAEDALGVEFGGALAQHEVGRAGDEGHLAGGQDI